MSLKREGGHLIDLKPDVKKQRMAGELQKSEFLKEFEYVSPLRTDLFSETSTLKLTTQYESGEPYKHFVIHSLCSDDRLRKVRNEIIENLNGAFKETDLFKVVQTGDLANMDYLEKEELQKIQELLALRNSLYSKEFRDFIQKITGCADLIEKADCSINTYLEGGHLLCHDDVITTRCVSYIVYLTDPDEPWVEEDGGNLELYPLQDDKFGTAAALPSKILSPIWNSMVVFPVQPGKSFHAVQEVLQGEKPRLSISGWFHAAAPPPGFENASLQSLQCTPGQDDASLTYKTLDYTFPDEDFQFSKEDKAFLSKYINPTYLQFSNIRSLISEWEQESCLQLRDFLCEDLSNKIREATKKLDVSEGIGRGQKKGGLERYKIGISDEWKLIGPSHKQRFLEYNGTAGEETAGQLLQKVQHELFESAAFAKLIKQISDLGLVSGTGQVRRFRAGMDYSVAHYGIMTEEPRLDVTLCFVDDASEEDQDSWDSDEVGGFQSYMLADENKEAQAEVYKQNENEEDEEEGMISCSACSNTLNIILRDKSLMKFVKYINYRAPGSRWDVAMQYKVDLTQEEIDAANEEPLEEPAQAQNGAEHQPDNANGQE
eukprot:TRINITY_DN12200_c0_g1_i1.p1 TRINITY_DN12200_c0_g1~~TRINITY_DN12200_c0_g1_i1.p1  ORF type:complete len:602 (-),score=68.35 TRINITY_DN12200_c0_g1_i1:337-2142(-)